MRSIILSHVACNTQFEGASIYFISCLDAYIPDFIIYNQSHMHEKPALTRQRAVLQ